MPDEQKGKQRWREVPPLSDDERWVLDNPPPLPPPPASALPPPKSSGRSPPKPPPIELDRERSTAARSANEWSHRRDTFRPPDEPLTETLRRQRAAARPRPIGNNTVLAAVLAIVAIALMVVLTMYLAKQT